MLGEVNTDDPADSFNPLYRGTWFPTRSPETKSALRGEFQSAISRYLVSNSRKEFWHPSGCFVSIRYIAVLGFQRGISLSELPTSIMFQSAISRYLVSNPTSKTPPLTSGGGNGLHTPRRIDHIPTFASLNHDKNTRSTHYTPNAGIELSETTPPPLPVNPVQNCA